MFAYLGVEMHIRQMQCFDNSKPLMVHAQTRDHIAERSGIEINAGQRYLVDRDIARNTGFRHARTLKTTARNRIGQTRSRHRQRISYINGLLSSRLCLNIFPERTGLRAQRIDRKQKCPKTSRKPIGLIFAPGNTCTDQGYQNQRHHQRTQIPHATQSRSEPVLKTRAKTEKHCFDIFGKSNHGLKRQNGNRKTTSQRKCSIVQ